MNGKNVFCPVFVNSSQLLNFVATFLGMHDCCSANCIMPNECKYTVSGCCCARCSLFILCSCATMVMKDYKNALDIFITHT
jgi:hypothetical protein